MFAQKKKTKTDVYKKECLHMKRRKKANAGANKNNY